LQFHPEVAHTFYGKQIIKNFLFKVCNCKPNWTPKNIIENTQVRFANISIKVSDEFMRCVEEQNQYGKDMILVYKKKQKGGNRSQGKTPGNTKRSAGDDPLTHVF